MKRLVLIGLALSSQGACSGKTVTAPDPASGSHDVDGTYVVTSTHDPTGAPAGFQPPLRVQQALTVSNAGGEGYRITWKGNGTSFGAGLLGESLVAKDAVGNVDPHGADGATAGVTAFTVRRLDWDLKTGLYREVDELTTSLPGGGREYTFIEGRVDSSADSSRQWLRYRADTNYPWDLEHGGACTLGGSARAEGYVGVTYGTSHDELRVYLQGIGCEIRATRSSEGAYVADGAECSLDPELSIAVLGITSWKFEAFSLDPVQRRLAFVVRATRSRDDGELVDLCFDLDSDLTGDFPT